MKNRMTITIHTCDKFSDIWEPTIHLMNENWGYREARTLLVTDRATDRTFSQVEVVSTGATLDMPARMKAIISEIDTEYVFVTLDDYFLTKRIDSNRIRHLLDCMDQFQLDYLSFKNKHPRLGLLNKEEKLYELDLYSGDNYIVNLYPGIWRKDFLAATLDTDRNIWDYEVSLTASAKEYGARCAVAKDGQFEILDGIRKGVFLHQSNRYLKEHQLYHGDRGVITYRTEIKLDVLDKLDTILPRSVKKAAKKVLGKFGYKFFSE